MAIIAVAVEMGVASTAYAGITPAVAGGTPLDTVIVASGLSSPVFVTHAPGDASRIFIVEQGGRIKILRDGSVLSAPFLDISSQVVCCGERGLLGLAFHPDFASNGFFYVNYTEFDGTDGLRSVISRFTVSPETPDDADESSERILLTIDQVATNHNGGWIGFGPNDGYLYIATGDGGGACDPQNTGQDLQRLLGKILRVDVDGGAPFGIPPDNPFVGQPGRDEIWAYGVRNPWRCAFDRNTGDFYIADVGQDHWEEINYQPASSAGAENYGWDCMEGLHCAVEGACDFGAKNCQCPNASLVLPVHEYDQSFGCAIVGGEVYAGSAIPDLIGTYFFADNCSGRVWSFRMSGGDVTEFEERTAEMGGIVSISAFGLDADGEMYLCSLAGSVHKIVPISAAADSTTPIPTASTCGCSVVALGTLMALTLAFRSARRRRPPLVSASSHRVV